VYKDPLDERLRAARRKHYHANKEQYAARNQVAKEQKREYIRALKAVPCTDCGVQYPYYVMQFDHIGSDKVANIANLINKGWTLLKAEVKKCEVVCANCHAERTHRRSQEG
jgi:hypothetical protein